jgi:hypothetical protein
MRTCVNTERGGSPLHEDVITSPPNIAAYAIFSGVSFLFGMLILILIVWKAEMLIALGLTGNLFYVLLIPMGLASAGFLFGVLRSVAIYNSTSFGGTITLGGPVVAAALVVWGGFQLPPPPPTTFEVTVLVHGPGGPEDRPLRGKGSIIMVLDGDPHEKAIDPKGAAYFVGIAAKHRNSKPVDIFLEADDFERADRAPRVLTGDTLYLPIRKRGGRVYGHILQKANGQPLPMAIVEVAGYTAKTDENGWFDIFVEGDHIDPTLTLYVRADGFASESKEANPGANEITLYLEQKPLRK